MEHSGIIRYTACRSTIYEAIWEIPVDYIHMKPQGAERIMKQLEGKSPEKHLEYWKKGTEDLR